MADHEFKEGDEVAHPEYGNGKVVGFWPIDDMPDVRFEIGCQVYCDPETLRPRNFLAKIAEEPPLFVGVDTASGPDVGFESIATPQGFREFITDKYGIKRDPVTLLEIESDGLVQISSIKDTVRSMG